jgi:transcriptional regulator GlxA family with amidase domain
LAAVAEWMLQNLGQDLRIEQFARKAFLSPRTFARRFRANMETTLAAWLNRQRIIRAQQLLEQTDLSLEMVAANTGFGTASVMRHHFVRVLRVAPTAYRQVFCDRFVSRAYR